MGLRIKFNLILVVSLIVLVVVVQHLHQQQTALQKDKQLMQKAEHLYQLSERIRQYTAEEIQPLLAQLDQDFLPQAVGSYAATQVFDSGNQGARSQHQVALIQAQVSRYQANAWQRELIEQFQNNPELPEITTYLRDAQGPFYVLAHPIVNDNQAVGAKLITIQTEASQAAVDEANLKFLWQMIVVVVLIWFIINVIMHYILFKPLSETAIHAQSISRGEREIEALKTPASFELKMISEAFNRMQNSLQAAMNHLS